MHSESNEQKREIGQVLGEIIEPEKGQLRQFNFNRGSITLFYSGIDSERDTLIYNQSVIEDMRRKSGLTKYDCDLDKSQQLIKFIMTEVVPKETPLQADGGKVKVGKLDLIAMIDDLSGDLVFYDPSENVFTRSKLEADYNPSSSQKMGKRYFEFEIGNRLYAFIFGKNRVDIDNTIRLKKEAFEARQ